MWGIIPAAGVGSRIQPLAFSKELLPVGSRFDGRTERPRAVSEYLLERMLLGGASKLCFVISPGKSDIVEYYGGAYGDAHICYVVQPQASGLCDAIFRAAPFIEERETAVVGLPDTVWFPSDALAQLPETGLSFLLFPVRRPQLFDAVLCTEDGRVLDIQVKSEQPQTHWVWGTFKVQGGVLRELQALWLERRQQDQYIGTLVNAYLQNGGKATAVRAGTSYVDVGTVEGYRHAMMLLAREPGHP